MQVIQFLVEKASKTILEENVASWHKRNDKLNKMTNLEPIPETDLPFTPNKQTHYSCQLPTKYLSAICFEAQIKFDRKAADIFEKQLKK